MDYSVLPVKYWGEGKTLFIGEEVELEFTSNDNMRKAIRAIQYIDIILGGKEHESNRK